MAPRKPDPDVERKVKRLHGQGLTDSEIARRLGVHQATAQRYRARLGLASNYSHPVGPRAFDEAEARKLHARGLIDREIAGKLGVSRETVSRWRRVEGLPRRGRPGRKERGTLPTGK